MNTSAAFGACMGPATVADLTEIEALGALLVGQPGELDVLKDKPGRRRTVRVSGPLGTVIVKAYASTRAATVAARVDAVAAGPPGEAAGVGGGGDLPLMPRVVHLDIERRIVALTQVPGQPLSELVRAGDLRACGRAGKALGRWHRAWTGRVPEALGPHRVERELELLADRLAISSQPVASLVDALIDRYAAPWPCITVVHRDLYEEQILVDETTGRIGLIDLDDTAAGPAELDVGNLLAHLQLAALRHRGMSSDLPFAGASAALLDGYRRTGPGLDELRLEQCTRLARLRLACIHDEPALLEE